MSEKGLSQCSGVADTVPYESLEPGADTTDSAGIDACLVLEFTLALALEYGGGNAP